MRTNATAMPAWLSTNLEAMAAKRKSNELSQALKVIRPWLRKLGYSLTLDPDTSSFHEGQLGEYERGSVFEKDIVIRVSTENIWKTCEEDPFLFPDYEEEVHLTVFHEVGHALMEHLIDYAENIDEFLPEIEKKYCDKFFDIFNDDNLTEETLVEDFARGFGHKNKSILQECAEKCLM